MKTLMASVFLLIGFVLGYEFNRKESGVIITKSSYEYEVLKKQYKWMNPTYFNAIKKASVENEIPIGLIAAIIHFESRYGYGKKADYVNPSARGPRIKKLKNMRALGLMQVLPINYKGPKEDLLNPEINIKVGSAYLAKCYRWGNGSIIETVKNYNSGPRSKFYNMPYIKNVYTATTQTELALIK